MNKTMSKCQNCRKNEGIDTLSDRIRSYLMWHLFGKDVSDEKSASFTAGIGDGYKIGYKHALERQERIEELQFKKESLYEETISKDL